MFLILNIQYKAVLILQGIITSKRQIEYSGIKLTVAGKGKDL